MTDLPPGLYLAVIEKERNVVQMFWLDPLDLTIRRKMSERCD